MSVLDRYNIVDEKNVADAAAKLEKSAAKKRHSPPQDSPRMARQIVLTK
jgi:hypothetical protein